MSDPSHQQRVLDLIRDHFETDPNLTHAHWFAPFDDNTVRLIEVSLTEPPTDTLFVFSFRPTPPQVPFRLQVADIHPDDWQKILSGVLTLPKGWQFNNYQTFSRHSLLLEDQPHV